MATESDDVVLIKSIFLCLFIPASFIGNSCVIYTILKNKDFRTAPNFFIFNLALTDSSFNITGTSMILVTTLSHGWPLGRFMCDFTGYMNSVLAMTSIWTLVMISVNRYFAVARPLHMKKLYTKKKTLFIILMVWFFALLISSPPLLGWSEFRPGDNLCTVNGKVHASYTATFMVLAYIVPLAALIFFYTRIMILIRKHFAFMAQFQDISRNDRANSICSLEECIGGEKPPGVIFTVQGYFNNKEEVSETNLSDVTVDSEFYKDSSISDDDINVKYRDFYRGDLFNSRSCPNSPVATRLNITRSKSSCAVSKLVLNSPKLPRLSQLGFHQTISYTKQTEDVKRKSSIRHSPKIRATITDANFYSNINSPLSTRQTPKIIQTDSVGNKKSPSTSSPHCISPNLRPKKLTESVQNLDIPRGQKQKKAKAKKKSTRRKKSSTGSVSMKKFLRESQLTRMSLVVFLGFFLSNTPFFAGTLLYTFNAVPKGFHIFTFGTMFGILSSVINPFIYAVLNEKYRRSFISIFKSIFRCCFYQNKTP